MHLYTSSFALAVHIRCCSVRVVASPVSRVYHVVTAVQHPQQKHHKHHNTTTTARELQRARADWDRFDRPRCRRLCRLRLPIYRQHRRSGSDVLDDCTRACGFGRFALAFISAVLRIGHYMFTTSPERTVRRASGPYARAHADSATECKSTKRRDCCDWRDAKAHRLICNCGPDNWRGEGMRTATRCKSLNVP